MARDRRKTQTHGGHHVSHASQRHHRVRVSAQCLGSAGIPLTSTNAEGDGNRRDTTLPRAKDVAAIAYVEASGPMH
jgi:hypothetical protein